ncbi:hypothetical protein H696_02786 [Fonticula alba]|uniref:methionine--tRNA ligase n=1 Tax=Fonticula alba TaxID=691883 RepID=A0A058Z943_FONAL|nr:hypothetical protein H696_02786 [Fonticula alba]KCV70443.1 hypothetical protein H696_02786 [Fonticula alba]|eukprot:XP_009494959.1 hypothetical protein H696_02786 [Fonticula alba]
MIRGLSRAAAHQARMCAYFRPAAVAGPRAYMSSCADPAQPAPHLITLPIFYVNADPHIGHLHTSVLGDLAARWRRLEGTPVLFAGGTDEHGQKIQEAAARRGLTPEAACDETSARFRALFREYDISVDDFIRTTDARHREAVSFVWRRLLDAGLIYKGTHSGWYSVSDETFVPPSKILLTTGPAGEELRHSAESGHPLVWVEEEAYLFRLSQFRDQLDDWLRPFAEESAAAGDLPVVPHAILRDVLLHLDNGLKDLNVSRSSSKVAWGIPVPDDPDHTIYVWLDALTNYLTVCGYGDVRRAFPPEIQLIGKDITRFHLVYWPAFLLGLGLPLPRKVVAHPHWTVSGRKMSKSLGNVVDPMAVLEGFSSPDPLRYFLLREGGIYHDTDFELERVAAKFNGEIVNQLGNLVQRAISPAISPTGQWPDVESMLRQPADTAGGLTDSERAHFAKLEALPHLVRQSVMRLSTVGPDMADIVSALTTANALFQDAQPWALGTGEVDQARRQVAVAVAVETARVVAGVLQAFIPRSAAAVLDRLNVTDRSLGSLLAGSASGRPAPGTPFASAPEPIMQRLGTPAAGKSTGKPAAGTRRKDKKKATAQVA